ncbi:MAG: spondin domain-containing protein [Planctomycetota bacterium]
MAFWAFGLALIVWSATAVPVQAVTEQVIITIENLAPEGGVYFTPVWLGFHDGSYDLFDPGGLASEALEQLAEDGDAAALRAEFAAAVGDMGGMDDVVTAPEGFAGAPVYDPGDAASSQYTLDSAMNRYVSFVSMIIPSNDAFIGNHNPHAIELFDIAGNFKGKKIITILGSMVWDAGTELNNEMDAAFINQAAPNTGTTTMCPVLSHPGYLGSYGNPGSEPVILGLTEVNGVSSDSPSFPCPAEEAVSLRCLEFYVLFPNIQCPREVYGVVV